jgi:hypothetical protein
MKLATALAVALICFAVQPLQATDYQELVDNEPWRWDGEQATLLYSVFFCMSDHQVEIISPKLDTDGPRPFKRLRVRILEDGKEIYSFEAHRGTVFSRFGDVLYIADFFPATTGCSIVAYDFKANKELWKTRLKSISHLPHSAYHNAVMIENDSVALKIRGKESLLHYVEYVDMKTGKTLAQREYPWKEN